MAANIDTLFLTVGLMATTACAASASPGSRLAEQHRSVVLLTKVNLCLQLKGSNMTQAVASIASVRGERNYERGPDALQYCRSAPGTLGSSGVNRR